MPLLLTLFLSAAIGPMSPDAPAHEPQLAVHGKLAALAFGAGNSIYFSLSQDSGANFAHPVKVGDGAILPLTRHRGPRIAFAGSVIVITAVTGKTAAQGTHAHGLPTDGDLLIWRSTDNGKTWSKPAPINDVPGAPTEGLHTLAAGPNGALFAAWLDKRAGKTRLYGAVSKDAGLTWSANTEIYASPDGTICECCHPSAAFDGSGNILVMWRNWLNGSRDMYLARSKDGQKFSAPEKLGEGTWKLNACPMDGGGIAVSGTTVTTVWRREHSLFLAHPGQPETSIGDGIDVAITGAKEGIYAIWSTPESVTVLTPAGAKPAPLGTKGAFPSIAALPGGGALAAWENEGQILTRHIQ